MFEDMNNNKGDMPQNAVAWYEKGLSDGMKLKDPQSKWILDENENIVCRNCGYAAPYSFTRGYCCGAFCANCGCKMEELGKHERK